MDTNKKLLPTLVIRGKITKAVADDIWLSSVNTRRTPEELLLQRNLASEEDILSAKAEISGIPFISLKGRAVSAEALTLIPEPVARKYVLLPFELDKKLQKLSIALADPLDLPLIEFLEQKSGKSISTFFAKKSEIQEKIEEEYARSLTREVSEVLKESGESTPVRTIEASQIGKIIKDAPVAKIVSTILENGVKSRASDIHIEPQPVRTRVRYRIDGVLQEKLALPKSLHDAIVSRIKILSFMKIDERRIPQDGRFNFKLENEEVDLRVSSLPTTNGEKIMMRLLRRTGGIPSLSELGVRGPSLTAIEEAITRPYGFILVTGPTGSGKTTTLYSILSKLNSTRVNIITLEDPIEYEISGINQVQVNPSAGLTFVSGLRSLLRQDPNIILVGEIRDRETTSLAIQAALTGHLFLSTLHTNNAATAIPRLIDLGAEPFLLVSVLIAVQAQRIIRRICPVCKTAYTPSPEICENIRKVLGPLFPHGETGQFTLYKGKGCAECNDTGYFGRIGIFEVIPVTRSIAKLILHRATSREIQDLAIKEGMISLEQDGYLKAIEGITTLEEVLLAASS